MALSYVDTEITKILTAARINALLAARERKTWSGARSLTRRSDGRSVRLLIEELEQRLGYSIITADSRRGNGVVLTPEGEALARHCEVIHLRLTAIQRGSRSRAISIVTLPHHDQLILSMEDRAGGLAFTEVYLDEHQRSSFEEDAIVPLLHGAYDLAIGLPPENAAERADKLTSVALYQPQLQAMVPRYPTRDSISLEELATRHRLLVPSPEFRSRRLLDDSIARSGIAVPPDSERIRLESHITKNLIRYGWHGKGTVVLPSDIALVWKEDGDCAGVVARNFRWIPVLHDGVPLTHPVNATMRADDERTEPAFALLLKIAAELKDQLEGR